MRCRGRSGYEMAAFIAGACRARPHVPVLLLASPFEPLDRERAEAAGVAGEISKPFDPGQLVARVRELLAPKPRRQLRPPARRRTERPAPPALKLVEPVAPAPRGALDDYFDRLDAALERLDEQITASRSAGESSVGGAPTPARRRRPARADARQAALRRRGYASAIVRSTCRAQRRAHRSPVAQRLFTRRRRTSEHPSETDVTAEPARCRWRRRLELAGRSAGSAAPNVPVAPEAGMPACAGSGRRPRSLPMVS